MNATNANVVEQYLTSRGYSYTKPRHGRFLTHCCVTNGTTQVLFEVTDDLLVIRCAIPFLIEPHCCGTMAEVAARINFSLPIGKFELDYDEGTMLFSVSHVMNNEQLTESRVECQLDPALFAIDQYFSAIAAVLFGNASPSEAIAYVERYRWH